jgi:2Fe-2S ferredoxin
MPKVKILWQSKNKDLTKLESAETEAAPGETLLEVGNRINAPLGSPCGGAGACGQCHVWVREGLKTIDYPSEEELDALELAFGVEACSRLACQAKVGKGDIVVEISPESRQAWINEH